MKRLISTMLFVLAAVGVVGFLAVQSSPVAAKGSAALSIVPKKNYIVQPGKSVDDTLMIRNIDRENTLVLNLRVFDFESLDDSGTPKLLLDEKAEPKSWSLRPFMSVPKTVTIEPNSTKTVDMSVEIPAGHGAGSYYSAIVYSSGASDGANVGLSASGVTLVFVDVPGKVKENLVLEKLGTYDSGRKKYTYFNTESPKRIAYTLRNEGNVAESTVGSITLKNIFGQKTVIKDINPNGSLALIGQTRTFESCVKMMKEEVNFAGTRTEATTCADSGLFPGYYTVNLDAYYGKNGNETREINGTASFWYMPWWFILLVIAVLAFVGYHVWRVVRYFKKRQAVGTKPKSRSNRKK